MKFVDSSSKKVFIVHGHDEKIKNDIVNFLYCIGVDPLVLHEQPNLGKTIIEKLEHYSNFAKCAIIILTKDDHGGSLGPPQSAQIQRTSPFPQSKKETTILRSIEKSHPRARQNVIFEFGYFVGKLGRNNVIALCDEDIEKPSDIDGVVYIKLDRNQEWKRGLMKDLLSAGIIIEKEKILNC